MEGFTPVPPEFAEQYRAKGYWLDVSLGEYFCNMFRSYADRIALETMDEQVSYGTLMERTELLARHLIDLGIKPLDRIVVQLPNCLEFVYFYFAMGRIGAIPLLALPPHRRHEIGHFVSFVEAIGYAAATRTKDFDFIGMAHSIQVDNPDMKHVFVPGEEVPEGCISIRALLDQEPKTPASALGSLNVDPDEPAVFLLSGGTTGLPKVIPRTHNDYVYNSVASADANHMDADTVLLVALPIEHNFPLASPGIQGALLKGGRGVIVPSPRPTVVLEAIQEKKCTHLELVPAALIQLLHEETFGDYDLSSVKIISTGGQRLQPEVSMQAEERFPNATVQEVFGMAEGLLMYNDLDDPVEVRHLTAGKPVSEGDEIKLIDADGNEVSEGETGEFVCRGPYTLRGYYKAPDINARSFSTDGFYLSGDLMRMHPSGNVIVEGRIKDLINRGGEKISAEEVENMIIAHPNVQNVACVPMPDPILGERTCAYIIPDAGKAPDLKEIQAFLGDQGIAKFKFPERIEEVDSFPLSPFGKVSKKDLTEMIAKKIEAGE